MRRGLALIVGAPLLVGLTGVVGSSALADNHQEHPERNSTMLTLYATETASTPISAAGLVDAPEEDFGVGGRFLSVDTLYSDAARTQRVGRNDINCDIVEVTGTTEEDFGASLLCSGVIQLDGQGSLAWQTAVTFGPETEDDDSPFATVAITGGTGAFMAAGGQAVLFDDSPEPAEGQDPEEVETLSRYEVELLTFETAAAPTTEWVPADPSYYEPFSGEACGTTVTVAAGDLRATEVRVTSLPDGSTLTEFRGGLSVDVTRESDGAMIDELDVSGPGFEIVSQPTDDGKVVITVGLEGTSIVLPMDPVQAASLVESGLPEFLFFSGGQVTFQDVLQLAESEDGMPTSLTAKTLSNTATGVQDVCKMLDTTAPRH